MKRLRIYPDTSVIGGCLDPEFSEASLRLVEMIRRGEGIFLLSELLELELERAPDQVRAMVSSLPIEAVERVSDSTEAVRLRDAYLAAGVVGPRSIDDAHHVALATVARADVIVSWNFKHIVHFAKIRQFNAVNLVEGYALIDIRTPEEVA
jgi:predicted nucleic acid-binding protein